MKADRALWCWIAVALSSVLAGCGTMNIDIEPKPTAEGLPEVRKSPLHAGVYYSPQFATYDHVRVNGNVHAHVHLGPASVGYFDQLLARLFEKTSRVETLAADELAGKGVDVVVAPSLEHFDSPIGLEPYSERFGVAYRITLYTPGGVPASSWVVNGSVDHWGMIGGHLEAYIQKAGTEFVQTFEQESAPGLAAIAASRQRAPQRIDVAALRLSARRTELVSVDAKAREQLRKTGFVFVEVSATPKTAKPVLVRASDMRLRLKDGRVIDASPPSALLVVATANIGTPAVVGATPLFGLIASLATAAAASSESDKRRGSLSSSVGSEFFGERVLLEEKGMDGGVVFFRLPPGASADGATVTAWAVEPATAAGSQVEMPLTGR
jgi:hypothetical protein